MNALLHPLRESHLWFSILWALVLALALAGWDWAELQLRQRAAQQRVLLLPAEELSEAQRGAERERIAREAGVAGAQWLSPAEQSSRLAGQYSGAAWRGMFSGEEGWLPWVLEVAFSDPLSQSDEVTAFAARRAAEPAFPVITWDNTRLAELRALRAQLRAFAAAVLVFTLLAGVAGLMATAPPGATAAGGVWRALLGAGAPGAVLAAAWLAGAPLGARTAALALAAGFVVAALIAPMLRQQVRGRQLSVSVGEGSEERI